MLRISPRIVCVLGLCFLVAGCVKSDCHCPQAPQPEKPASAATEHPDKQNHEHQKKQKYMEVDHDHSNGHGSGEQDPEKDRWLWQQPQKVMNSIGVKPGMSVADIGAGTGYFTFRLAQRVGESGKVYANEIYQENLDKIVATCKEAGIENVVPVLGTFEDPNLEDGSVDLAVMVNVFHFLRDYKAVLENLKKDLKPGAKLVIVQWDADKMSQELGDLSDEDLEKYAKEPLLAKIKEGGFKVVETLTFLPQQNIYICAPK